MLSSAVTTQGVEVRAILIVLGNCGISSMGKEQIIGGAFRAALVGGAWLRLAIWCRSAPAREINVHLEYKNETAEWSLELTEHSNTIYNGTSESLEGVTMLAVTALGKAF